MSLTPWWSCGRRGWLGSHGSIVNYIPNVGGGTATVTFEYTDYACDVTLLPAQLVMPAGPLQTLPCNRWRVFNVPYDSFIVVLMHSTSGLYNVVTMPFSGNRTRCAGLGTILDLQPAYDQIGAECLTFTWGVDGSFPWGFKYSLSAVSSAQATASGMLPRGATSLTFDAESGVQPSQLYRLTLEGACDRHATHTGALETALAITTPGPALGPGVVVDSVEAEGELVYLTLRYTDYFCVENVTLTANGVAASVIDPPLWSFLLQGDRTVYVDITAQAVTTAVYPSPCLCISPQTLNTRVAVWAPLPVESCDGVEITNLETTAVTASCLTFSWDRNSEVVSYSYVLAEAATPATPVAQGTITVPGPSNPPPSASIPDLTPSTQYIMTVMGNCSAGGTTASADITVMTSAASTPEMLAVETSSISFAPVGTGLYNVFVPYPSLLHPCMGGLTLVATARPGSLSLSTMVLQGNTMGVVLNVPSNVTADCYFVGSPVAGGCTSNCVSTSLQALTSPYFTFSTPSGVACLPVPISASTPCAELLTVSWAAASGLYSQFVLNVESEEGNSVFTATTTNPTPRPYSITTNRDTAYFITLAATCITSGSVATSTKTVTTPSAMTASLAPILDTYGTWQANGGTCNLIFRYPQTDAVCVQNLQLYVTGGYSVYYDKILNGAYQWTVEAVPSNTLIALTLAAQTASCGCTGTPEPQSHYFEWTTPSPSPVIQSPPYTVTMLNYGGPPEPLLGFELSGDMSVVDGAGDVSTEGSYLNQWTLNDMYAWHVVMNFIKFNCQEQVFNYTTKPYETPRHPSSLMSYKFTLAAMYYGVPRDPTVQGASKPQEQTDGTYIAKRAFSFCDSTLGGPGAINPDTQLNFAYPPMLAFFKRLITYNWNVAKGVDGYTKNPQQIQLALTLYGSLANRNEQWHFCADFDGDGNIITVAPSDPTSFPSIINGVPNDGNEGYSRDDYKAGWNCMERWFMYAGYCNQQLRRLISNRQIVTDNEVAMTLDDIGNGPGKVLPTCCQISAITCDQESNGFENTTTGLYVPPGETPSYDTTLPTQQAACNAAIAALWNKWLNQTIERPDHRPPPDWPEPSANLFPYRKEAWSTDRIYAPAGRAVMPATSSFTLDPAFSMTTTNLIPGMNVSDLGSPNFYAINACFPEIYDTFSNNVPISCLGVTTQGGTSFNLSVSGKSMYDTAFPRTSTDPCAKNPLKFNDLGFSSYDNLVLPPYGTLTPTSCGSCPSSTNTANITAFNDSSKLWTPRMQTSQCTPWRQGQFSTAAQPWALTRNDACDYDALAWALEGSRYDLYNGKWAAAVAQNGENIDYTNVSQNSNYSATNWADIVDGGTIWADLSTGLKIKVAANLKNCPPAAPPKIIWMLSTESGPFVNCAGVERSARGGSAVITDQTRWLTFACPDTALDPAPWPGWLGMENQWWGPGTKHTAGVVQRYATDQFFNGVPLYTGFTQPMDIPTGSTEDNFGVFHDFGIIAGAWARMALDMTGQTLGRDDQAISPGGLITGSGGYLYPKDVPVSLGCYELAFLPLSWYSPNPVPYPGPMPVP